MKPKMCKSKNCTVYGIFLKILTGIGNYVSPVCFLSCHLIPFCYFVRSFCKNCSVKPVSQFSPEAASIVSLPLKINVAFRAHPCLHRKQLSILTFIWWDCQLTYYEFLTLVSVLQSFPAISKSERPRTSKFKEKY